MSRAVGLRPRKAFCLKPHRSETLSKDPLFVEKVGLYPPGAGAKRRRDKPGPHATVAGAPDKRSGEPTSATARPRRSRPSTRCRQGDRQVLPPLPQRGIPQLPRLHIPPDIHMDNYAARKTEAAGSPSARRVHCTPTPWPGRTPLRLVDGKATEARCPLFDDNVYQRGEALVLKPALGGAGFEADRGACGALKCRCPAAAFGCAGRKECCRAGEPSASTSMTAGSSRRPPGAAPPGSGNRRSAPDLQPGRQRLRRSIAGGPAS